MAYAISAVVSAVGENTLMPDYSCIVINGKSGYLRNNSSWIIGRITRDLGYWMFEGSGKGGKDIEGRLHEIFQDKWEEDKKKNSNAEKPRRVGLCVSVYAAGQAKPDYAGYDVLFLLGIFATVLQLSVAAIPCGVYGDWSILLITAAGTVLSYLTGSIPQWSKGEMGMSPKRQEDRHSH